MLMISRKKKESFVIQVGEELITITVTDISTSSSKKQVQIGVDAPAKYKVWRWEIYEAIQENKKAIAAQQTNQLQNLRGLFPKKTNPPT